MSAPELPPQPWACPWDICPADEAQKCRASMGTTKRTRGCGTYFPPNTTPEQAKQMIRAPAQRPAGAEPVHQRRKHVGPVATAWHDCSPEEFEAAADWDRRIIYVAAPSSVPAPAGWIPVAERLPERDAETVLIAYAGHVGMGMYYRGRLPNPPHDDGNFWTEHGSKNPPKVTHWMPLPAAPSQESPAG